MAIHIFENDISSIVWLVKFFAIPYSAHETIGRLHSLAILFMDDYIGYRCQRFF